MTYYSAKRGRTLGASPRVRRNSNVSVYQRQQRLGPVSNVLLVGLLITMLGLLYLVQITKTSVYGFELGELRQAKTELEQRNESLRVEAARLQSLQRVEGSDVAAELVEQNELSYLSTE